LFYLATFSSEFAKLLFDIRFLVCSPHKTFLNFFILDHGLLVLEFSFVVVLPDLCKLRLKHLLLLRVVVYLFSQVCGLILQFIDILFHDCNFIIQHCVLLFLIHDFIAVAGFDGLNLLIEIPSLSQSIFNSDVLRLDLLA